MKIPDLIKAGDQRVLLGLRKEPPMVDCRVWGEDNYQKVVDILDELRTTDIQRFLSGDAPLLPQPLRSKIHDFLTSNGR